MAQIRITNFGDTLTAKLVGTIMGSLAVSGLYIGYDVVVIDPQTIEIQNSANPTGNVGYLLLPDGILLSETLPVRLTFGVFPNVATTYTLVARHTDAQQFGGSAATYEIRTGFFAKGSLTDGTVIAWIYYPGSGVGLSQYQIVQPPRERLDSFVTTASEQLTKTEVSPFRALRVPAVHHTITDVRATMAPLQTGTWNQTMLESSALTVGTEVTSFFFDYQLESRPSQIEFSALIDVGCNVQVLVKDTTGATVVVNPASAFTGVNPPVWSKYVLKVPPYTTTPPPVQNGTFTPDLRWEVEVRVGMPLSKTCLLGSLTVSFLPTLAV